MNTSFDTIGIIDEFESALWVDRYDLCGDAEIYTVMNTDLYALLKEDYYIRSSISEHLMIVEDKLLTTDIDEGSKLTITCRSAESILDRRIIWAQTILSGNLQNAILKLLNENVINPAISSRKIPNFIFKRSTDPSITSLIINAQFTGDNLYDAISYICMSVNIGFKITLNDSNQFVFELYAGTDRSYAQETNSYVIFSPGYDNIVNSRYLESIKNYKNVFLIAGEGEGSQRTTTTIGSGSGLTRREDFVDARDISSTTETGPLTPAQYIAQLQQRGKERQAERTKLQTFEGEVEASRMFVFEKDFFMGDILQVTNEYGIEARSRVLEMIFSENEGDGFTTIPTFGIV